MATQHCQHGMAVSGCTYCRKGSAATAGRTPSRQKLLDELCDLLGIARHAETPGSSPRRVFAAAAASAKVPSSSMPEIGAAIAAKAGLDWGPQCDNRGRTAAATMVTGEGIATVSQALAILTDDPHPPSTKKS